MTDDSDDSETRMAFDSHRADAYGDREVYRGEVYQSDDGEDSADAVDPKKLFRTPSVNDIRWYYRNGTLAPTIVDKPVDDAFKFGFSVGDEDKAEFLDEIVDAYKTARKKARRDGFALIWFRLRDTAEEWQPPENVAGMHEAKVLTLDDMTRAKPLAFEEKLSAGNVDNFDHDPSVNASHIEGVETIQDLVERSRRGDASFVEDADGDIQRIVRDDSDPRRLDLDRLARLNDPDIDPDDLGGRLPYGRSRFYETTDDGIVFSNRMDDERFEKPIGYLYSRGAEFDPILIHHSRVFHVVSRSEVDGDVEQDTYGEFEGDSVLRPIIHTLRTIQKSNWAVGQTIWRDSAPLRVVNYEEGVDDEHIDKAEQATRSINAKSTVQMPPGFEIEELEGGRDTPIEEGFDVLFDQVCAATEFTRSVLFGTQSGTVSGSETDIKNYFNKVERTRVQEYESDLEDIVNWYASLDRNDNGIDYDLDPGLDIEWGPLFRLSELDKAEAMARHVQLVTQATSNFVMTPDEARSVLSEQWADWTDVSINGDAPIDVSDLENVDNGAGDDEMDGNPAVGQNGGGREGGDDGNATQPNTG